MVNPPIHTSRPTEQHKFVGVDKDVYRGPELIARARSHTMAKRIAFALNLYNQTFNEKNQRRGQKKDTL